MQRFSAIVRRAFRRRAQPVAGRGASAKRAGSTALFREGVAVYEDVSANVRSADFRVPGLLLPLLVIIIRG